MKICLKITIILMLLGTFTFIGCGGDDGGDPAAASTNADLSGITLSAGTLSPAFDAATIAYTVNVANTVDSVTITGAKADANATVSAPVTLSSLVVGVHQTATITVTAQSGAIKVYTVNVIRFGADYTSTNQSSIILRYVPAGSFQRDATSTNISTITSAYRMSRYEITRAQYSAVMGTDPSDTTYSSGTDDPVQRVTWYDSVEFCNKLSTLDSLTPVYTITSRTPATGYPITAATVTVNWNANGYRLPTEMEWMWAAMGATSGSGYTSPVYLTGYGKLFAGSNSVLANGTGGTNVLGDYAWWGYTSGNAGTTIHTVGTRYANELGLYDMSGSVWEWCWDWYADNGTEPNYAVTGTQVDYSGEASGANRVMRGGSFSDDASYCTVAYRYYDGPNGRYFTMGFRVVRP